MPHNHSAELLTLPAKMCSFVAGGTMSQKLDPLCQPSLPLTKKGRVPDLACVALFYSEDSEEIYHVFETHSLKHSLSTKSRYQTAALRKDPSVRVAWIPCEDTAEREKLTSALRKRFHLPDPVSSVSTV